MGRGLPGRREVERNGELVAIGRLSMVISQCSPPSGGSRYVQIIPRPCDLFGVLFLATACFVVGCGRSERDSNIALSDPSLTEFSDLLQVDRAGLGIPPLPAKADVVVDRYGKAPYDAMLHIYAMHQSRTIAFRRENGAMKWIGEQVVAYGPRQYTTVDGTYDEEMVFNYETSRVSGGPLNQLDVNPNVA